jgi:hypothetical protein
LKLFHLEAASAFAGEFPHVHSWGLIEKAVFGPKKKMLFHFDYGDDWDFLVTCVKIEEIKSQFRRPKILDKKGTTPEQYPDYEE